MSADEHAPQRERTTEVFLSFLQAVAIESKRTIDIDEFVPKDEKQSIALGKFLQLKVGE